ncbi:MAG TPA: peptidoglycan editing factor PgeF [Xanthobacteraceae bacterium]|nr:peptidoglycan editing factor PgeF [Xanthobacteraceae bacterium]
MILAASLTGLPRIRHAFFTRDGGVSLGVYATMNGGQGSKDDPRHVAENRRRMAAALEAKSLVTAFQHHSATAVTATEPWTREHAPRADAVVTKTPGIAIGVTIADCGPVLFADGDAGVIAAAHAGWRGAFEGIVESTVAKMEELGARRENIAAVIGPLIRQPSYEVGAEFVARFQAADASFEKFFRPAAREGHAMFDLPGFIALRLEQARVGTVQDLGLDTYSDETRFYSYRRTTHRGEPDYGRLIAAIALAEK